MSKHPGLVEEFVATEPSLTVRSVVLSTLLGTDPPVLPISRLVRIGALFGFAEGTTRTSVTRMVGRGELRAVGEARYELGADLRRRQVRQQDSRAGRTVAWDGAWVMAVAPPGAHPQHERRQRRDDLAVLRFAPLRDGVHLRPDNLPTDVHREARARLTSTCRWFRVHADERDDELAAELWDLDAWVARADRLRRLVAVLAERLDLDDPDALAPGFVVSAAVLRHLQSDPLLPREIVPRRWNGERLRSDYDRFDAAYRRVLGTWWRAGGAAPRASARQ